MDRKTLLVNNFNKLLDQLLSDISSVFPENTDITLAKFLISGLNKAAPTTVITQWHTQVNQPYQAEIMASNLEYFLQKDYSSDFANNNKSSMIMSAIDKIRDPIREMSETNKATSLKYIQNLCKLADMYQTLL